MCNLSRVLTEEQTTTPCPHNKSGLHGRVAKEKDGTEKTKFVRISVVCENECRARETYQCTGQMRQK